MNSKLSWSNVSINIKDKCIVDNNFGSIESGKLLAIMGPSGSGKTTLLNYLSNKNKLGGTGTIKIDGTKVTDIYLNQISRYVEQEDCLIGSLTVEETIHFSGKLSGMQNRLSRNEKVNQLLEDLGLVSVKDVVIGTPIRKGISGGQKRRVSIACELITLPSVLFLDEPTSGLDSKASFEVISTIKKIAKNENIIVIMSIHQPSSTTFDLFDKVMFLSQGKTVYNDEVKSIIPYFELQDIHFNPNQNISEFVLDMINTDFNNGACNINDLHEFYLDQKGNSILEEDEEDKSGQSIFIKRNNVFKASNIYQIVVLCHRSFLKAFRDVLAYYVRMLMYMGLAIMMGTVWLRLVYNQAEIQLFINAIFFSGAFMSFMSVAYIPAYLEDYNSFKRENSNGLYGPLPFILSNFLISIPFLFVTNLIFCIITFFLVNFHQTSKGFWYYVMWLFLDLIAAESLTVLLSTVFPFFVVALALTAFANGLWMSVGGFLVSEKILNVFWYYTFYWIDYQRYVFQGMMFNQFSDTIYTCGSECQCMYSSDLQLQCRIEGAAVLSSLGYSTSNVGFWVGMILVITFFMRLLTYGVLRLRSKT